MYPATLVWPSPTDPRSRRKGKLCRAVQRQPYGSFWARQTDCLIIDVHGVKLVCVAARFRVAHRPATIRPELERVREARNDRRALFAASSTAWENEVLKSTMGYQTMCGLDHVRDHDSRNTLRNASMEKGAEKSRRYDQRPLHACQPCAKKFANTVCALCCLDYARSPTHVAPGISRGFSVLLAVVCALPIRSTSIKGAGLAPTRQTVEKHFNACSRLLQHLISFWSEAGTCLRHDAIFHDLIFNLFTGSKRLCFLGAGLIDALSCACKPTPTSSI